MKTNDILKISFLVVIEAIFCFTPLGSIPIGPIVATLSLIPVIISSLVFGEKVGGLLGFVMAIFSLIVWTFIMSANPVAFIFTPFSEFAGYKGNFASLIICFIPRILSGITPAYVIKRFDNNSLYMDVIASIIGSLTNTILVMLFIFIFFRNEYEELMGNKILILISMTILTNGIPEAIVAGIVCPAVSRVLKKI